MKNVDSRPLFIFEMANNHMGRLEHGLRILREVHAAASGFRQFQLGFKLQYRHLDTFLHPAYRDRDDIKYVKRFRETRLAEDELLALSVEMDRLGLLSVCTPFDERSVDLIEQHGIAVVKIASCSFTDWPLLERVARTNKPVIASTAGAALEDMDKVVSFFQHRKKNLSLMHCVARYPTAPGNLELNQIDLLRSRYPGLRIGYSTHEAPDFTAAVQMAIAKGASILEKHVGVPTETIQLNAYSANPQQVRRWMEAAVEAYQVCGVEGRRPDFTEEESASLCSLRRGVFAARALHKNEKLHASETDVLLAIPAQLGQITANDLSKYTEFHAQAEIALHGPILFSQVAKVDRQAKVIAIVRRINAMIEKAGVIVPGEAEFEISHHFGIDRFEEIGATIISIVNREYCKKLIVMLPGQRHPEHLHKVKEETFLVVRGDISIELDGAWKDCGPGDLLVVERGARHSFHSKGGVIMEEISSTHHKGDSYYADPAIAPVDERKTVISYWLGEKGPGAGKATAK
jgi:N-acetylneuraminate synthase